MWIHTIVPVSVLGMGGTCNFFIDKIPSTFKLVLKCFDMIVSMYVRTFDFHPY